MTEAVSWGVLGTASIALNKVIPAMKDSQLSRVVAIASRSPDGAGKAAEQLGIPTAYGSYQDLLDDPAVEAVYIPLPNHLHAEWTMAAARAGKHVLCEKPMAMTAADAQEMVDTCRAAGVLLMEAFMYRLHPMWLEVRRLVDSGLIGELMAVQAVFSYRNLDPSNIRNIHEMGGGALFDIGCYPVNAARMLFGSEPTDVRAIIRRDPTFGTDVISSALLDFDGRHAVVACSTQLEDDQRVALQGTQGRLVIEIPFNIPPDRPTRILHVAGGDPPVDPHIRIYEVPAANQYTLQADALSRSIRTGTLVPTPPEDAVANLAALERVFADAGLSAVPAPIEPVVEHPRVSRRHDR